MAEFESYVIGFLHIKVLIIVICNLPANRALFKVGLTLALFKSVDEILICA